MDVNIHSVVNLKAEVHDRPDYTAVELTVERVDYMGHKIEERITLYSEEKDMPFDIQVANKERATLEEEPELELENANAA